MEIDSPNKVYEIIKELDEYLDENDKRKLIDLILALYRFSQKCRKFDFKYHKIDRKTNSLYRFGWFEFNNDLYFIYNWNFRKGLVVFMNENETQKVTFSIDECDFVKNKDILFPSWIERMKKKIRYKLKLFLKELSEKL